MTVQELINKLMQEDPEHQVMLAYDYGDRYHTLVTTPVCSVEKSEVVLSAYHNQHKLVDSCDDHNLRFRFPPNQIINVIVLR